MRTTRPLPWLLLVPALLLSTVLFSGSGVGADDLAAPPTDGSGGGEAKAKEAPKTVEVQRGPFTVTLELSGTFEPKGAVEVSYKPQAYGGDLEVVDVAAPGSVVKGQVLVRFKTEKIDEQIQSSEADLVVARANVARQTEESKRQEESSAIALARGQTEKRRADEALKRYREVELPLKKSEWEHSMQGTENFIQDQTEELNQLEKMYKADDLTEATEEIVLRRAQRNLERARRSQQFQKQRHALFLDVEVPNELENLTLGQRKQANDWDKLQATSPLALEQSRLELAKTRLGLERQEQGLQKLRRDRDAMVIVAPEGGTAVPGTFSKGKWGNLEEMGKNLRVGQKVPANQVLFTILRGGLGVRTEVAEADVLKLREGHTGALVPTAAPDLTIGATVARVARVSSDGNFDVHVDLATGDERLMPGYGCKLKIDVLTKSAALTVPTSAVSKEDDKTFVHVWADGKSTAREVKTGATSGGRTEVLEGVEAGLRVLEAAPKKK
jgi:hypothetical protein